MKSFSRPWLSRNERSACLRLVMSREIDLRGSFRFGNVFELAVGAITSRRVDVRPVISGEWPLQQAAEAIQIARDKTRSMKVQLVAA